MKRFHVWIAKDNDTSFQLFEKNRLGIINHDIIKSNRENEIAKEFPK
jgi:hypothetical protein